MPATLRIPLNSGAYQARSVIANAQRAVNLYAEPNPPSTTPSAAMTHYPTPGLTLLAGAPQVSVVRGLYTATNGDLYAVVATEVYYVSPAWQFTRLGSIGDLHTPVGMWDNGLALIIVDGTANGYAVDLATRAFGQITDPSFYGADRVDYCDTFFVLNRPGTAQWYISLSEVSFDMLTGTVGAIYAAQIDVGGTGYTDGSYPGVALTGGSGAGATADITVAGGVVTSVNLIDPGAGYLIGDALSADAANIGGTGSGFTYGVTGVHGAAFDALDIAAKQSGADPIQSIIALDRQVWLPGAQMSEVWYNSGAADFTFSPLPGDIEHGCAAKYSIAKQDVIVFFLAKDRQGTGIVVKGQGNRLERVSTFAIEAEIQTYPAIDDAIGFCWQQIGHAFYVITFPTANKTWVYDISTEQWHEWASTSLNGVLGRHRANAMTFAYNTVVAGDWQNGQLYAVDPQAYTDAGQPITRIRAFPHVLNDGKRAAFSQFSADIEVGTLPESMWQTGRATFAINGMAGHNGTFSIVPFDETQYLATEDGRILTTEDGTPLGVTSGAIVLGQEAPVLPQISLRTSMTRGKTWGNAMMQSLGAAGQYSTWPSWNRLGMGRDCVFELSWSVPTKTALQGAWINVVPSRS